MTQEEALSILKMGHSCYLAGEAGTGKTHVLNSFISWMRDNGIEYVVTASTGIAATHLGGSTVHSWSGIGIKDSVDEYQLEQMEQKKAIWDRIRRPQVLVVDEISMLPGDFLDMLDKVCRHMRRVDVPFGGMQVILSGDFFQLPPVDRDGRSPVYAFQSSAWKDLSPVSCYLRTQYRHDDPEFVSVLSAIRNRNLSQKELDLLETRKNVTAGDITRLFTHNIDVDDMNEGRLDELEGEEKRFTMYTSGREHHVESLMKGCLAPEVLRLKEGARVMFVKNDTAGSYVNGTQGVVVGFSDGIPQVEIKDGRVVSAYRQSWRREDDGNVTAEITQVPLRLAWAITVHKSQGMTLDEAEMDLSKAFVPGQGYVALSRVRSLQGLYLRGLNDTALEVDKSVLLQDRSFKVRSDAAKARLEELGSGEIEKRQREFVSAFGKVVVKKVTAQERTKALLEQGMTLKQVASERGVKLPTIISHAEKILQEGSSLDLSYLKPKAKIMKLMQSVLKDDPDVRLSNLKRKLEQNDVQVTWQDVRLARLYIWAQS